MNGKQLTKLLTDYECLKKTFIHIIDLNNLHDIVQNHYPQVYIIKPGKHWICVIFYNSIEAEYFDSLGKQVNFYGTRLVNFITNNSQRCTSIQRQTQANTSNICGLYVVFFVTMRLCFKMSLENVYDMLSVNRHENDRFVKLYFLKVYSK